jgi:hypothetical protein
LRMSGRGLGLGRVGRNRVFKVKVLGTDGMGEAIVTRSSWSGGGGLRRSLWMDRGGTSCPAEPCKDTSNYLQFTVARRYTASIEFIHHTLLPVCYVTLV